MGQSVSMTIVFRNSCPSFKTLQLISKQPSSWFTDACHGILLEILFNHSSFNLFGGKKGQINSSCTLNWDFCQAFSHTALEQPPGIKSGSPNNMSSVLTTTLWLRSGSSRTHIRSSQWQNTFTISMMSIYFKLFNYFLSSISFDGPSVSWKHQFIKTGPKRKLPTKGIFQYIEGLEKKFTSLKAFIFPSVTGHDRYIQT